MSFFNNEKNICTIENASYEYKRMKEIGKFSRNRIFLLEVEEIIALVSGEIYLFYYLSS